MQYFQDTTKVGQIPSRGCRLTMRKSVLDRGCLGQQACPREEGGQFFMALPERELNQTTFNSFESMEGDVAIVGYSYRMPGGIRSDDYFWHLLSEREIIQEPVTDRYGRGAQPIGGFQWAGESGQSV